MSRRFLILAAMLVAATQAACVSGYGTLTTRALAEMEVLPAEQRWEIEGKHIAFEGSVISVDATRAGQTYQILTQDREGSYKYGPMIVGIFPVTGPPIAMRGDYIAMLGFLDMPITGTNAFGVSVRALSMRVIAVHNETTYQSMWVRAEKAAFKRWNAGTLIPMKLRQYGR